MVLVLNDHVLKGYGPSILTGKLSDVAGLIAFPLFLQAGSEMVLKVLGGFRGPSDRGLVLCIALTGLGFTLVQLSPSVNDAFRWTLGVMKWPLEGILRFVTGGDLGSVRPVRSWSDPTDLWILPALMVAYAIGRTVR